MYMYNLLQEEIKLNIFIKEQLIQVPFTLILVKQTKSKQRNRKPGIFCYLVVHRHLGKNISGKTR